MNRFYVFIFVKSRSTTKAYSALNGLHHPSSQQTSNMPAVVAYRASYKQGSKK